MTRTPTMNMSFHFSISSSVTLAPGGRSWHRDSTPPSSASRASHAASTSTVSASAALSAEALGLPWPTLSQYEGLASCFAINLATSFFLASCFAVSGGAGPGSIDEAPQHQRIGEAVNRKL
eukprot:scaffold50783_cov54-Phaeocystis_antarctica.AAC.1